MRGRWAGWMWIAFPVVVAATLASAYGAYTLAGWSWDQVVSYRSPYTAEEVPAAKAGQGETSRLVLVIVDGLRGDASREMDSMQRLRANGADLTLIAEQPSLSFPTWTTILSGSTRAVSGVTTNWFEERVPVETLIDTALSSGKKVGVVGPKSFETLYGANRAQGVSLMDWDHAYLSGKLVDEALRIDSELHPDLLIVHLPDVDEAGHESGGASKEYAAMVRRVDGELARLVEGTQDAKTAYAIGADHGHIDTGGHGGWESIVVRTPFVLAGDGVRYAKVTAPQDDLAPTLAVLLGIPVPRHSLGVPLAQAFVAPPSAGLAEALAQRRTFARAYQAVVERDGMAVAAIGPTADDAAIDRGIAEADGAREYRERMLRLRYALPLAIAALLAVGLVGLASRRALIAALVGAAAYYALYDGAYFLLHGYRWSLSAFNSEDKVQAFFNMRMVEAAIAGLVAALVAGAIYALMRKSPQAARGRYLPGWLTLGPATVLVVQATLALQVAWFVWWWGPAVTWRMPDFLWAFKFDLDLIQTTALGAAAVLAVPVTLLVGRYHPRVRRAEALRAEEDRDLVA